MPYEANLWQWLKKGGAGLTTSGALHINRVETSATLGFPDVEGVLNGRAFTIELKGAVRPKHRASIVVLKIRQDQVRWNLRRWAAGGNNSLLIRVGVRHAIARYLIPGKYIEEVSVGVPEHMLTSMSVCDAGEGQVDILYKASDIRALHLRRYMQGL